MAKSPTESIRELMADLRAAAERDVALRRDVDALWAESRKPRDEAAALRQENVAIRLENATLRQEIAVLRQRLDDHLKRVETWSARLWTLITVLVGAVLALASGLIVALNKK